MTQTARFPFAPPAPARPTYTTWLNPLAVDQHVDVYEEGTGAYRRADGRIEEGHVRYTIPAGGKLDIPSRHDRAIHVVHNGVVIGGKAPQLKRQGSSDKLDPSLDPKVTEELERSKRTAGASEIAQVLREGLALAAAPEAPSAPAPKPAAKPGPKVD